MAIMEVVLTQEFGSQYCINRFNYVSNGTPAAVSLSFALASALGAIYDGSAVPPQYPMDGLIATLSRAQATGVIFQTLSVKNVYSDVDFYETGFTPTLTGAKTGETMPPFAAFGFYSSRVRQSVRRGMKRFVGLTEQDAGSGGRLTTAFMDNNGRALETALSAVLEYNDEGNVITFSPAICGKESYIVESSGRKAYRYYSTETEQLDHTALGINWNIYTTVRSQVSRQYGRGR